MQIGNVEEFSHKLIKVAKNHKISMYHPSMMSCKIVGNPLFHIKFIHSPTSTEDDMKILREYHFYISDDQSHSTEFVHGYFQLFYGDLANRGIP